MSEPTYLVSPRKVPYNEQQKLTATFLNNLATALIVASCITPALDLERVSVLVLAPTGIMLGGLLHMMARFVLSSLRD